MVVVSEMDMVFARGTLAQSLKETASSEINRHLGGLSMPNSRLSFSAQDERIDPYEEFSGSLLETVPKLCRRGRFPANALDCVLRRLYAPDQVKGSWKYLPLDAGDAVYFNQKDEAKIALDAVDFLFIDAKDESENGAVVIDDKWDSIPGNDILSLNSQEVGALYLSGYSRKRSGFEADNKTVEKVTDFLLRGREEVIKDYLQMVGDESSSEKILVYRFNQQKYFAPIVMRPIHLEGVDAAGSAITNCRGELCLRSTGRVIGILPEFSCRSRQ